MGNLDAIREVMSLADQEFEATAEQYKQLARTAINQFDLRLYVKRVLRVEDDKDISTRTKNIIERIIGLSEAGKGNDLPNVRGTLWAGYNAVTEYLGYTRGNTQGNRLDSLWFGDSAGVNKHALEVALDMAV